jgi:hypothetical protein
MIMILNYMGIGDSLYTKKKSIVPLVFKIKLR